MDFIKKIWANRQSQYPNRRKLTETNIDHVYEVERAEGEILEPGNQFNAENMNDLENRVNKGFTSLHGADIAIKDEKNYFTATKLDGVLNELFTYADNGRKTLVSAIGATRKGTPATSETFTSLANRVKNDKVSYYKGELFIDRWVESKTYTKTFPVTIGFPVEEMILRFYATVYCEKEQGVFVDFHFGSTVNMGESWFTSNLNINVCGSVNMSVELTPLPSANNVTSVRLKVTIKSNLKGALSAYKFKDFHLDTSAFYALGKMT